MSEEAGREGSPEKWSERFDDQEYSERLTRYGRELMLRERYLDSQTRELQQWARDLQEAEEASRRGLQEAAEARFFDRREAMLHRRHVVARVALALFLVTVLGALGLGVTLIAEGISRSSTGFATLGVVLVVVSVLASGVGGWQLSGPGIEFRQEGPPVLERPVAPSDRSPGAASDPHDERAGGSSREGSSGVP